MGPRRKEDYVKYLKIAVAVLLLWGLVATALGLGFSIFF